MFSTHSSSGRRESSACCHLTVRADLCVGNARCHIVDMRRGIVAARRWGEGIHMLNSSHPRPIWQRGVAARVAIIMLLLVPALAGAQPVMSAGGSAALQFNGTTTYVRVTYNASCGFRPT